MSLSDRLRVNADAVLALGTFGLVAFAEGRQVGEGRAEFGAWVFVVVVCAALPYRRRYPVAVGWFTALATGAYYLVSDTDGPLVVVPVVALYALAAGGRLWDAVAVAGAMVGGVFGASFGGGDISGTAVFMLAGWLVAVVALGTVRHGRAAHAEEVARLRATEERLRIARDLHDVIGHHISMVNVQASAALHRLKKDPAQAEEALGAIKAGSKEALRELRATLGVLRQADEAAPTSPAPGLARLQDLADAAEPAGLAVRIARTGTERPLPAPVDLAAYRIVQESLTNAARHSGAGHVDVHLAYGDGQLTLTVEDDGPGTVPREQNTGTGIAGMTERARTLGGDLTAGPRPAGGFTVRARLPYRSTAQPTQGSDR
ncbi:sensor histidine kinase [Streptomyces roseirectus]|uniref:histidine kinase n=1 Tax=Streptomyces roseirectus TaxID=2768066 RepID=A0A7H0I5L2_9ACTN|nr:sensor histidine kinase [Streptomyces roseirectus]QNP68078.1 sensor histidine kinase [Streptomyces roseirectus]